MRGGGVASCGDNMTMTIDRSTHFLKEARDDSGTGHGGAKGGGITELRSSSSAFRSTSIAV